MAGFFIPDEQNIDSLFKEASKKTSQTQKEETSENNNAENDKKESTIIIKNNENNKTNDEAKDDEKDNNISNNKNEIMNKFQQNLASKNGKSIIGERKSPPIIAKKENIEQKDEKTNEANEVNEETAKDEAKEFEKREVTNTNEKNVFVSNKNNGIGIKEVAKIISIFNMLNKTNEKALNFIYKIVPQDSKDIEIENLSEKDKKFSFLTHSLIHLEKENINNIVFIITLLKEEDRVDRAFKILETDSKQIEQVSFIVDKLLDKQNPEKINIENQDVFRIVAKELESSIQTLLENNKEIIKDVEQLVNNISI